jgi:hypothetical protein
MPPTIIPLAGEPGYPEISRLEHAPPLSNGQNSLEVGLHLDKEKMRITRRPDLPPYRLENWNRLRAPGCPDFLRSFILGSRVSKPSSFKAGLIALSCSNNARAIANRTAPACPVAPPPFVLILTSKELLVFVTSNGFKTVNWREGVGKYSSSGRPLTSIFPDPPHIRTWATAFLRRPVAVNTSDIFLKFVR